MILGRPIAVTALAAAFVSSAVPAPANASPPASTAPYTISDIGPAPAAAFRISDVGAAPTPGYSTTADSPEAPVAPEDMFEITDVTRR